MSHTTSLKLKGLKCGACKQLSERKIKRIAGVESVNVDLKTGSTAIVAARPITLLQVQSALAGTDYLVEN